MSRIYSPPPRRDWSLSDRTKNRIALALCALLAFIGLAGIAATITAIHFLVELPL